MKSTSAVTLFLALAFACTGSSTIARPDSLYRFNYENVLGTSLELTFSAMSEAQAHKAETAALSEIDRELKDPEFLGRSSSEFSRWARTHGRTAWRVAGVIPEVLGL